MRRPLLAALLLALAPHAAAQEDLVVYLDERGRMEAGTPAEGVEPVSKRVFEVTPVDGFHHLRFALGMDPPGLTVDALVAEGTLRYRMQVEVFDADGALVASLRYDGNATYAYEAPDERPLRVELSLRHGAGVEYHLRVSALPDPRPV